MIDLAMKRSSWPRAWAFILIFIVTACSGQRSDCGNNVSAILGSQQKMGPESGLLGGMVKLADGKECYAAFDVLRSWGSANKQFYQIVLWTGHHCEMDVRNVESTSLGFALPSVTLRIFGQHGYTDVVATNRLNEVAGNFYAPLTASASRLSNSLRESALTPPSELMLSQQSSCRDSSIDNFCATYSDVRVTEVLIGSIFGSEIPDYLHTILNQALQKRDESRALAQRGSGTESETYRMSQTLIDYWRVWHQFAAAPIVDLWRACQTEGGLVAFTKQSDGQSWDAKLRGAGSQFPLSELQAACPSLIEIAGGFSLSPIFGETIEDALKKAQLLDGDRPRSGQAARAFTEYLIAREKALRSALESKWVVLSRILFASAQSETIYIHTNVVLSGTPGAERTDRSSAKRSWQHAIVPFSAFAGSGRVDVISAGVQVLGSNIQPDQFGAVFD